MKRRFVFLSALALLALGGSALGLARGAVLAQVSDNYDLSWHVLAPGGREGMTSGSHAVHGTLGQFAIGPAASGATSVGSGYWAGVARAGGGQMVVSYQVYLPLIVRSDST
jgi:hypothetical protein